jgi:hypothetical protein
MMGSGLNGKPQVTGDAIHSRSALMNQTNIPSLPRGADLAAARGKFEGYFDLGPIGHTWIAPTGEPYVVICSGGMKEEGQHTPALCSSAELAVKLWFEAAMEYARSIAVLGRYTLYWRIVPELNNYSILPATSAEWSKEQRDAMISTVWMVYSRLLISAQPCIATEKPAENAA